MRRGGLTGDDGDERDTADELEEAAPTALGGLGRECAEEASSEHHCARWTGDNVI